MTTTMSDEVQAALDELIECAVDAHNALRSLLRGEESPRIDGPGSHENANLAAALGEFGVVRCEKCGCADRSKGPDDQCFYCRALEQFPDDFVTESATGAEKAHEVSGVSAMPRAGLEPARPEGRGILSQGRPPNDAEGAQQVSASAESEDGEAPSHPGSLGRTSARDSATESATSAEGPAHA